MQFPVIAILTSLAAVTLAVPVADGAVLEFAESSAVEEAAPIVSPDAIIKRSAASEPHKLFARLSCAPQDIKCDYQSARNCADFLYNKGTTSCQVNSSGYTTMCGSGDCIVRGKAVSGPSSTSSYCRDVGLALRKIVDNCSSGNKAGGQELANGNGYFNILLTTSAYNPPS